MASARIGLTSTPNRPTGYLGIFNTLLTSCPVHTLGGLAGTGDSFFKQWHGSAWRGGSGGKQCIVYHSLHYCSLSLFMLLK